MNPAAGIRSIAMYQAPKLERLGTFREVTLAGGAFLAADGSNPHHRYSAPAERSGGAHVLAPRKGKTGVLTGYFARSFRADPNDIVRDAFARLMLPSSELLMLR